MDLGYVFVAQAFGIQLIWALAVLLLEKTVFRRLGQKRGSNNG